MYHSINTCWSLNQSKLFSSEGKRKAVKAGQTLRRQQMFLFIVSTAIFIKYQRKPCKSGKVAEPMLGTPLPQAKQSFLSCLFFLLILR